MNNTLGSLILVSGLIVPGLVNGKVGKPEKEESKGYEPLQIIRTVEIAMPNKLLQESIDQGEADIVVMINNDGQLMDWIVVGYSHPLFVKEVLDVLQKWKFVPAYKLGKPISSRAELKFVFKNSALIRVMASNMGLIARQKIEERKGEYWTFVCRQEDLDAPLDAKVEISPMPPDQLGATAKEGRVVVEYLVDPEGKVRMPLIISADDEAFARSVLLPITQCRYHVPRREGAPVITRVRHQFTFTPVGS